VAIHHVVGLARHVPDYSRLEGCGLHRLEVEGVGRHDATTAGISSSLSPKHIPLLPNGWNVGSGVAGDKNLGPGAPVEDVCLTPHDVEGRQQRQKNSDETRASHEIKRLVGQQGRTDASKPVHPPVCATNPSSGKDAKREEGDEGERTVPHFPDARTTLIVAYKKTTARNAALAHRITAGVMRACGGPTSCTAQNTFNNDNKRPLQSSPLCTSSGSLSPACGGGSGGV